MPLTDDGRDIIAQMIIDNGAPVLYDNAGAHLGVGDSATAFTKADTNLIAATNKFYQPMEATYPTLATNVITFRSLFATGDANYVWAEWGVFNAVTPGTMLCRLVDALGTKTSAQSWQLTVDITVNNP